MSDDVPGNPWKLAIRHPAGRGDERRIALELSSGDGTREVVEVPWKPILSDELREMVHWYFDEFRAELPSGEPLAERVERTLLEAGQALGHAIGDAGHKLSRFAAQAAAAGAHRLHVTVSSDDPDFLREPWELLLLPEAKYFAAAAGASFIRTLRAAGEQAASPPVSLALGPSSPLRILRIVDRHTDAKRGVGARGLRTQAELLRYGGALAISLVIDGSGPDVLARLSRSKGAAHIVHLCGRLESRGDNLELDLGNLDVADGRESIDCRALFDVLAASGAAAVILDVRVFRGDDRAVRARLALAALRSGIDNVVLLAENADAITAERCFHEVYVSCAAGLGLHQGVIEARKRLQKAFVDEANASSKRPYGLLQPWSLLTHWSRRDVVFLAQPAALADLEESAAFASARRQMFGFRSEHLRAEGLHGREADGMRALAALERGVVPVLLGEPGAGKTRVLHACALSRVAEGSAQTAFYWDCAADDYTADDVVQMMAGVLGVGRPGEAERQAVLDRIAEAHALLVFDNFPGRGDPVTREGDANAESRPTQERPTDAESRSAHTDRGAAIAELLHEAVAKGARCILSCDAVGHLPSHGRLDALWHPVELRALSAPEAADVVSETARLRSAEEVCALAKAGRGNPFLLTKISALAAQRSAREIAQECARGLGAGGAHPPDPVRAFYAFRWQGLDARWQRLLLACLDLRDFYVELLMLATDGPSGRAPRAGQLWEALDLPPGERFADAISAWESAGFLARRPYGRVIDPSAVAFLREVRVASLSEATRDRIAGPLAGLLCEGCVTLARRLRRQQHPWMTQHLIANRAIWAKHVQDLWLGGDYAVSVNALLELEALLAQAGLGDDYAGWAKNLLERTDFERVRAAEDPSALVGWLTLARASLTQAPLGPRPAVAAALAFWTGWIERASDEADRDGLFDRAFAFLQYALDLQGDHVGLERVCEAAVARYSRLGRTPQLIGALKLLSACEHELGHAEASRSAEERLLHDIDYSGLPAGARGRVVVELATMRRRQGNHEDCVRLLSTLDEAGTDPSNNAAAEMVRGELELDLGRDEEGAQRLCALWKRTLEGRPGVPVQQLIQALALAESKLGSDRFAAIYRSFAGDTPSPKDLQRLSEENRLGTG